MATGGSGERNGSLPDLDFLSQEERQKIEQVLRADEELNTRDEERLRFGSGKETHKHMNSYFTIAVDSLRLKLTP